MLTNYNIVRYVKVTKRLAPTIVANVSITSNKENHFFLNVLTVHIYILGNRCVKKMDHHCPWINHCVGWANHAYFTYFLGFAILGSFQASIILGFAFYRGVHRYWYLTHGQMHLATVQFTMTTIIMTIFATGLAIGVVLALGMLLYIQVNQFLFKILLILTNLCLVICDLGFSVKVDFEKSD